MDDIYDTLTRGLYKIQPAAAPGTFEISPEMIGSGSLLSVVAQNVGNLQNGKTTFDNTDSGFILGVDKDVAKFFIGNSTKYINWDGTNLSVVGGVSISQLDIPDAVTASSFHVNTTGDTWWGATTIGSAVAKVLATGVATFTNITATGTINATGGYTGSATAIIYESTGMNVGTTGHLRGGQSDYNTGAGFFLGYTGAQYKFSIGDGTVGNSVTWDGTDLTVKGSAILNQNIYGDGTDGDVTISGDTTLTADKYYNNLTINTTKTLTTAGYRVFVKGTLTINGTGKIDNPGGVGQPGAHGAGGGGTGAGGAVAASGFFAAGSAGSTGGACGSAGAVGGNGVVGDNISNALGVSGSAGVSGGSGGTTWGGGSGGGAGTATAAELIPRTYPELLLMRNFYVASPSKFNTSAGTGGSGGGGGGNNNGGAGSGGQGGQGGGSGGAGGVVFVAARIIVNAGSIVASGGAGGVGGNGANGTTNNGGGGGGGGGTGGAGGVLVVIYNSLTNTGTIAASGGALGAGGAKGNHGPDGGGDGSVGPNGNAGATGYLIQLQI